MRTPYDRKAVNAAAWDLIVAEHGTPPAHESPERTAWFAKHRQDWHDAIDRVRSGDTEPIGACPLPFDESDET